MVEYGVNCESGDARWVDGMIGERVRGLMNGRTNGRSGRQREKRNERRRERREHERGNEVRKNGRRIGAGYSDMECATYDNERA